VLDHAVWRVVLGVPIALAALAWAWRAAPPSLRSLVPARAPESL
jgi:hypothetical protein